MFWSSPSLSWNLRQALFDSGSEDEEAELLRILQVEVETNPPHAWSTRQVHPPSIEVFFDVTTSSFSSLSSLSFVLLDYASAILQPSGMSLAYLRVMLMFSFACCRQWRLMESQVEIEARRCLLQELGIDEDRLAFQNAYKRRSCGYCFTCRVTKHSCIPIVLRS